MGTVDVGDESPHQRRPWDAESQWKHEVEERSHADIQSKSEADKCMFHAAYNMIK